VLDNQVNLAPALFFAAASDSDAKTSASMAGFDSI
jgi:hypothetical protein